MRPDIAAAAEEDLPEIVALLAASDLPTADVNADSQTEFFVIWKNRQLVGVVGLERYGIVGLLRSLAVSPDHRQLGLGIALTHAVEERARARGLRSMVLLTETAAGFFERLGYQPIARKDAPAPVAASMEFRSLCPASATCMMRLL
jgi:N-acetylglutamate synthase-like GNAT family acetyltransferase